MARDPDTIPAPDPKTGDLVDVEENPETGLEDSVAQLTANVNKLARITEEQGNAIDLLLARQNENPTPQPIVKESLNPLNDPLKAMELVSKIQESSAKASAKLILDTIKIGAHMKESELFREIAEGRAEDAEDRADEAEDIARALVEKIREDQKEKPFDPQEMVGIVEQITNFIRTGKLAT